MDNHIGKRIQLPAACSTGSLADAPAHAQIKTGDRHTDKPTPKRQAVQHAVQPHHSHAPCTAPVDFCPAVSVHRIPWDAVGCPPEPDMCDALQAFACLSLQPAPDITTCACIARSGSRGSAVLDAGTAARYNVVLRIRNESLD